jgi:hypothetical protein
MRRSPVVVVAGCALLIVAGLALAAVAPTLGTVIAVAGIVLLGDTRHHGGRAHPVPGRAEPALAGLLAATFGDHLTVDPGRRCLRGLPRQGE